MTSSSEGLAEDAGAHRGRPDEPAELYRLLVASVRDYAIFVLDPDGHVLTWNAGAAHLKGYEASDIIGRHFSVFYPPEEVLAGKPRAELVGAARDGRFEDEGGACERTARASGRTWSSRRSVTISVAWWDSPRSRAT